MKWFKDVDNVSIESVEEFYNLVETHVYSKDDLIADSLTMDFETTLPVPREVEWEDFTESLFHGRCFTARNIGKDGNENLERLKFHNHRECLY